MFGHSSGRLNIYRKIKKDLTTESYVANIRSVRVRRALAGLQVGCLLLMVEIGHYTGVPFCQQMCRVCNCGEVEDQIHFLLTCPAFKDLRLQLFNHCNFLSEITIYFELLCPTTITSIQSLMHFIRHKSIYNYLVSPFLFLFFC